MPLSIGQICRILRVCTHLGPFVSEFLAESEYGRVSTHFQQQLICIFKTASKKIPRRGLSTGLPTQATHRHHVWTWDFIFDRTDKGGTLKMMTLLDEYTRQSLAIQVERQLTATQVLDVLARAMVR